MGDPRIDRIAARQAAQTAATHLTVAPLMADTTKMSDEQAGEAHGSVRRVDRRRPRLASGINASTTVSCIGWCRRTKSQADWTPDKTQRLDAGSLGRRALPRTRSSSRQVPLTRQRRRPGDVPGAVWESTMDANVWSPTAYPAGWKAVWAWQARPSTFRQRRNLDADELTSGTVPFARLSVAPPTRSLPGITPTLLLRSVLRQRPARLASARHDRHRQPDLAALQKWHDPDRHT